MSRIVGKALQHLSVAGLLLSFALAPAHAMQMLKSPKHPVDVRLKTDIWGTNATKGQIFEAELGDGLRYKEWTLPAGTLFRGQVTKVRHSKTMGRPGYVVLNADEAQLPDGTRLNLDTSKFKPNKEKTYNKDSLTLTQTVIKQIPTSAIGLGLTLPLSITGAASGYAMVPAGFGARMLAGSGFAVFGGSKSKYASKTAPEKVAYGALDGSGIIRLMGFMGKYPEPEYKAGETIKLFFNPKGLQELFTASANIDNNKAIPLDPEGPTVAPAQKQMEEKPDNLVKTPAAPKDKNQPTTATFP